MLDVWLDTRQCQSAKVLKLLKQNWNEFKLQTKDKKKSATNSKWQFVLVRPATVWPLKSEKIACETLITRSYPSFCFFFFTDKYCFRLLVVVNVKFGKWSWLEGPTIQCNILAKFPSSQALRIILLKIWMFQFWLFEIVHGEFRQKDAL